MTLASLVDDAVRRLLAANIPSYESRQDAALMARWLLGWDTASWLARGREPVPDGFTERFHALIERRAAREPVAQIVGGREFYGRWFIVNAHVLVPRPETELLVERALAFLSSRATPRVVDVGTGSGCVGVTIAIECPAARVVATDRSEAALDVAKRNAAQLGVADRVALVQTNLIDGLAGPVDLIVANLPYVPDAARGALAPEVADHEPSMALFGGPDGLDLIRRLVPEVGRRLAPGGQLMLEVGDGQGDAAEALVVATAGLVWRSTYADLQGIPRVVVAEGVPVQSSLS